MSALVSIFIIFHQAIAWSDTNTKSPDSNWINDPNYLRFFPFMNSSLARNSQYKSCYYDGECAPLHPTMGCYHPYHQPSYDPSVVLTCEHKPCYWNIGRTRRPNDPGTIGDWSDRLVNCLFGWIPAYQPFPRPPPGGHRPPPNKLPPGVTPPNYPPPPPGKPG